MERFTRRKFLQRAVYGSAAVTVGFGNPGLFGRALHADDGVASGREGRILVVLEMAGGNDGLNTIVPYRADPYYRHRPVLAVPRREVLRLDDEFGLHPSLAGLERLHSAGRLAVVHGVGYPNPNRSHFESMDIWHSARLDASAAAASTGWLGRWLDEAPFARRARLPALAVGRRLPRVLTSSRTAVPAVDRPEDFGLGVEPGSPLDRENRRRALEELLKRGSGESGEGELDFLRRAARDAVLSAEEIQRVARDGSTPVDYPATGLARALRFVGRLVASDLGARLYHVSFGGFDTHAGQDRTHPALLAELGDAIRAFFEDLDQQRRAGEVLLMTFSEFGRRVGENASAGTDHGAAGPMLLVSGEVRPGFHGEAPPLDDLADGDLRHTVDFRSVYAAVLEDWLGASPAVLGPGVAKLPGLFG